MQERSRIRRRRRDRVRLQGPTDSVAGRRFKPRDIRWDGNVEPELMLETTRAHKPGFLRKPGLWTEAYEPKRRDRVIRRFALSKNDRAVDAGRRDHVGLERLTYGAVNLHVLDVFL